MFPLNSSLVCKCHSEKERKKHTNGNRLGRSGLLPSFQKSELNNQLILRPRWTGDIIIGKRLALPVEPTIFRKYTDNTQQD